MPSDACLVFAASQRLPGRMPPARNTGPWHG